MASGQALPAGPTRRILPRFPIGPNRTNKRLAFDQVEVLTTIPFRPNQALIVVRSDNSWHSIAPMRGTGSTLMRKTVNINIRSSTA